MQCMLVQGILEKDTLFEETLAWHAFVGHTAISQYNRDYHKTSCAFDRQTLQKASNQPFETKDWSDKQQEPCYVDISRSIYSY